MDMEQKSVSSFAALLSCALSSATDEPLSPPPSTLAYFVSESAGSDACSLPSLKLKNEVSSASLNMSLEQAASFKLAIPASFGRNDITDAPLVILHNVSSSFMSLVESRLRSSLHALLRQSLKSGSSADETKLVMALLSSSDPISVTTVVTSFTALPVASREGGGELILPLMFQAIMDCSVFGHVITVTLRTTGTVVASLSGTGDGFQSVEITLDTTALLHAMMKNARLVVKRALSVASTLASSLALADMTKVPPADVAAGGPKSSMPPPPPRRRQNMESEMCSSRSSNSSLLAIATCKGSGTGSRLPHKKRTVSSTDLGRASVRFKAESLSP